VNESEKEAAMVRTILAYLADHPQAMDSVEGITGWWLMRQQIRADVPVLVKVLRRLVDDGVLETLGEGPACRYRLRRTPERP